MTETPSPPAPELPPDPLAYDSPRAVRAREKGLRAPYIAGGLVPLFPYIVLGSAHSALMFSCAITLIALAVFGYVKGRYTGAKRWKSAVQTTVTGGLAAAAAFAIARAIA